MKRLRRTAIALICGLLAFSPAVPAGAQAESPWRFTAEKGVCQVLYSLTGESAHGFSWTPNGDLGWEVYRKGSDQPIRLQVTSANGETFAGTTQVDGDKDLHSYILIGSDRRNARLILSGDLTFTYQLGGRRVQEIVPAGVQAPRIATCMALAREQAATGPTNQAQAEEPAQPGPPPPSKDGQLRIIATGSGVFVDGKGALITNAHVVNECRAVGSQGLGRAEVVAIDEASDLALLRFKRTGPYARLRETVRLGETVTAAGFPLQSVLANGLNVTLGNISALSGIQGDKRFIQISAPVQPGNSGGALLDANGRLVGIVEARLKREVSDPQNVNFAVAPYVVGAFLRENGVAPAPVAEPVKDVAALARQFTIQLECAA